MDGISWDSLAFRRRFADGLRPTGGRMVAGIGGHALADGIGAGLQDSLTDARTTRTAPDPLQAPAEQLEPSSGRCFRILCYE